MTKPKPYRAAQLLWVDRKTKRFKAQTVQAKVLNERTLDMRDWELDDVIVYGYIKTEKPIRQKITSGMFFDIGGIRWRVVALENHPSVIGEILPTVRADGAIRCRHQMPWENRVEVGDHTDSQWGSDAF